MAVQAKLFISYHSSDQVIAQAINRQITQLTRGAIKCFLDIEAITPGTKWRPTIIKGLSECDLLIVIYTGEQSQFVGFEVGKFSDRTEGMEQRDAVNWPPADALMPGAIIPLVDVEKLPALLEEYQAVRVPGERVYSQLSGQEEERFWIRSALGQLIRKICSFKEIYPPPLSSEETLADTYFKGIASAAKSIAMAYNDARNTDVISRIAFQPEMELLVHDAAFTAERRIPDDTIVSAPSETWALLNLLVEPSETGSRQITWKTLRDNLISPPRRDVPWMEKMNRDIARIMQRRTPAGDNVTLIAGGQRVFRPIITLQEIMRNGYRKVFVQFVETINRQFLGDPRTSKLLASIVLSSRYHFSYVEEWSNFIRPFSDNSSDKEFALAARQLSLDLDRIEHEGLELGLGEVNVLVNILGAENEAAIISFFEAWFNGRAALAEYLQDPIEPLTANRREKIRDAIVAFFEATRSNNCAFLRIATRMFNEQISQDLDRGEARTLSI